MIRRVTSSVTGFQWFVASVRVVLPWAILLLRLQAIAQLSSLPRSDFWVPDGPVNAVVETNGVVYIGGLFDYISPVTETGDAFDLVSAAPLPGWPKFNGAIKTIVTDNAGGWFVGGVFTAVGGFPITNLARIRADKSVDLNWHPNPDNGVLALTSGPGMLYVGGTFLHIGGQARSLLAALEPVTGTTVSSWSADVATALPRSSVTSLVWSGGRLYVGGYFTSINGVARANLGSVDALTGQVTSWFPNGSTGGTALSRVDALAISGAGVLFVGGTFSHIGGFQTNGPARNYLAALDTTRDLGAGVLPWNPDANGPVTSIAVSCDTVYVGGSFTSIGGTNRNRIAALDAWTGKATGWNPDADGPVLKVMLGGDLVYAGGKFTDIGGERRPFLAALSIDTGLATPWNPRADCGVAGLALSGGTVVAGGVLGPGGKARKNLAAFDVRTAQPLDWSPVVTGATINSGTPVEGVNALVASATTVYFGGPFTAVNGQPRNHLAAVDAVTGALAGWNPNANSIVDSLAMSSGVVLAGGLFTTNGGFARTNIASLTQDTGSATAWNPGSDGKVSALTVSGTTLYAGGLFSRIGELPRKRLAALSVAGGVPTSWDPTVDNQVSALATAAGRIYAGGLFLKIGTDAVSRIAAVDAASGLVTCWKPEARFFDGAVERSGAVKALVVASNVIYAGGTFSRIGGQTRHHLAALGTNCPGLATDWDPNMDATINALSAAQQSLVAGGSFQNAGGAYRPNLAVFPPAGSPAVTLQPLGHLVNAGQPVSLVVAAEGAAPLSYQWQLNGTNLPAAGGPTLVLPAAQVSDSGDYSVVITNSLGLVNSRPATVTVVEPVTITAQPASQTVAPGATVSLRVTAAGNPPPIYQWRLNGVDIPGAVEPTLTITNVQPVDGGSYSVVVASVGRAVNSQVATLRVTSAPVGFADELASRLTLSAAAGLGSGSNAGASREIGETNHVGKPGGSSVWIGWLAPASGIATFNTRGSSFDTLLAVYLGSGASNLVPLAADEDSGGFLTSQASFNVVAGTEYLIAIDGFAGAAGDIVLRWSLDTSTVPFPRLLSQPSDRTVGVGVGVSFSVSASSPTPVTYQWFDECRALDGETNDTLSIAAVQRADVGRYHVELRNASSQVARSFDASLDIGPDLKVIAQDKLEDLLEEYPAAGGTGAGTPLTAAATTSGGFVSVTAGSIDSQTLNNTGSTTQLGETNHCNVLGGASKWLGLKAETDGTFVIDTIGSAIDTVLAVYRSTNLVYLSTALVTCDNNGAPDGIRSLVRFNATGGLKYMVVVDGVNRAQGPININWRLGLAPVAVSTTTSPLTVLAGASATLIATATNGVPAPTYQWMWNGSPIPGANQRALVLNNLQVSQAGSYSVVSSNFMGVTVETNVVVVVAGALRLTGLGLNPSGHFAVSVDGGVGQSFVLQSTIDLGEPASQAWTTLMTNSLSGQSFLFLDTNAPAQRRRFYRALLIE